MTRSTTWDFTIFGRVKVSTEVLCLILRVESVAVSRKSPVATKVNADYALPVAA